MPEQNCDWITATKDGNTNARDHFIPCQSEASLTNQNQPSKHSRRHRRRLFYDKSGKFNQFDKKEIFSKFGFGKYIRLSYVYKLHGLKSEQLKHP